MNLYKPQYAQYPTAPRKYWAAPQELMLNRTAPPATKE